MEGETLLAGSLKPSGSPGLEKKERVRAGGPVCSVLSQVPAVWHSPSLPAAQGCARSLGEQEVAEGTRLLQLEPLHLD